MERPPNLQHKLTVVAVLLLAFALRLAAIDQIPPGLSHDEAYNGVTALQVLAGERRIFFEINKGIEPLIIYLEAVAFYLFGIGPVQLRLVNVAAGMLTVALVHPLAARLFNRRVAWLAMAGVAVSFWAVFVSRLTLRAVLLPPLLLLTLYFFWRALESRRSRAGWLFFGLAGLVAGLTMYTYLSSRFVPFILLTLFGYRWLQGRLSRRHWLGAALCLLLWAALFAPLVNYFWQNSASFTQRADQVTTVPHLLAGDPGPMLRNTLRTLGMFTVRGDTTDRYNLDGRPVFDWATGLLFYLGVGLLGWRWLRRPRAEAPAVLLFSAAFFMLLPDFITDDSPHFLRTIGALPLVYIFWAMGLEAVLRRVTAWLDDRPRLPDWLRRPAGRAPLIGLLLVFVAIHTGYDYFGRWAAAPEARYIYGADVAELARYLKNDASDDLPVISAEFYRDLDPFRFRLHFQNEPPFVLWFDGRQTLAFPPPESDLTPRYLFSHTAPPAELWTTLLQPSPEESGRAYTLYRLADEALLRRLSATLRPVGVSVNDDLVIAGYTLLNPPAPGDTFKLLLSWQALRPRPPGADYTFLLRVRDQSGQVWAETDGNGYPPADWQPGVRVLQLLPARLPVELPAGEYHLTLEVVDRRARRALPTPTGETVIPLGPLPSLALAQGE